MYVGMLNAQSFHWPRRISGSLPLATLDGLLCTKSIECTILRHLTSIATSETPKTGDTNRMLCLFAGRCGVSVAIANFSHKLMPSAVFATGDLVDPIELIAGSRDAVVTPHVVRPHTSYTRVGQDGVRSVKIVYGR